MTDPKENTASRRQHPRFHVDLLVKVSADNKVVSAHTRDISRSGLCLIGTLQLPREKEIEIELVLTFGEGGLSEPLHILGKVVWCTKMFGRFQIGVMFIKIDDEQSRNLDMFIGFLDGSIHSGELFPGQEETTGSLDPDDPLVRAALRKG